MSKPVLPFVETMITQVCNLSCVGCTNYSDLQHEGYVTWAEGKRQIESWLERVDILDFGIMGGEPLINPEVEQWITGVRDLLPSAQIRFTTNGVNLNKKMNVVKLLSEVGNSVFKITVHQQDTELENIIQEIFNSYSWQPVVEHGVSRYKTANNFRFQIKKPTMFLKTFLGSYNDMKPHDNQPADAFKICCQQSCPLLYNGRIYKCSTSGLLEDTLAKFNYPNADHWQPYIQQGIGSNCSEDELAAFLDNFGKLANICRMCPSSTDLESKIIHLENVSKVKIKW